MAEGPLTYYATGHRKNATAKVWLFPGGIKSITRGEMLDKRPERLVERTIKGMLPHNKIGAQMYRKLKVYAGVEHPHEAQKPQTYEF